MVHNGLFMICFALSMESRKLPFILPTYQGEKEMLLLESKRHVPFMLLFNYDHDIEIIVWNTYLERLNKMLTCAQNALFFPSPQIFVSKTMV